MARGVFDSLSLFSRRSLEEEKLDRLTNEWLNVGGKIPCQTGIINATLN